MKKRMTIWARTAKVLFLAIFSSFGTNSMAQTRIAVVSDIHVMAPSLLPSGAEKKEAWTTYYAGQRKMLEQSAGLFDQFVETLTTMPNDEKPHVLLITGDLTKDGEQVSHKYVRGILGENGKTEDSGLKKLEAAGIQVYVIPGNHDFGEEGNHTQFNADGTTGNAPVLSTANFASFYEGYGYGIENDNDNNFVQDPNGSLSYVAEIATDLYLLAIDSHSSRVSEATLTWICDQAQVIRGAGKRVIAMMHHPLFPHIEGADMFISTYTVANYETVRNALIAAGVNVILTGHFHTSDIAYDWNESQTNGINGIYDINTGSLISYPCDYRMLTLSADKSTLSVATATLTPSGWTADDCKTWLHNRVEVIAKKKMNDASMGMASLYTEIADAINNIAIFAADLFIFHAEGDEYSETNEEEREELKTRYNNYQNSEEAITIFGTKIKVYQTAFTAGGITDESIYSILDDQSNYGNDHENQTADRTLSNIALTTLEPSGTLNLLDDKDNRTAINCYDGKTVNVSISTSGASAVRLNNRASLYKDGAWNTICLPFTVNEIGSSQLGDADIRELISSSFNEVEKCITLYFSDKDAVTTMEAGKPYILKWDSGDPINNLAFNNVKISKAVSASTNRAISPATFVGTYNKITFDSDDNSKLLIGKNSETGKSTLFYPKSGASIGAFNAYFQLADDYTASTPSHSVRSFVMNFGSNENTTGIIAIGNSQLSTLHSQLSEWFTLDGRRLTGKPTAKGLYIHAGRKVVIK